jgi:outer membrane lipoprotein-sorting protein
VNILRRLPLSRLLLLCGVIVAVAIGATALALAVSTGPTPPPKPLAEAIHDALAGAHGRQLEGVSARIRYTNHLLEGADLASGGSGGGGETSKLSSSPLLTGATGRLWIGSDGRARLELQSEEGDTQILYDGHNASLYDAASNTLYRYTPPPRPDRTTDTRNPPSVAQIEEAIARAGKHAVVSGATPTDVAGRAAYTVRLSPRENGGLIGGVELSWDASTGVPLRAAIYSSTGSAPVIELAASEIGYGPVESSTLDFPAPSDAKIEEITLPAERTSGNGSTDASHPHVTTHGKGLEAIALLESPAKAGADETTTDSRLEGLQKVNIGSVSASELSTQLGTLLSFERAGVRYVLAGAVTPAAIEEFARGL